MQVQHGAGNIVITRIIIITRIMMMISIIVYDWLHQIVRDNHTHRVLYIYILDGVKPYF